MLVLGGCFVGLTSTASLLGPVMSAALLVAALVLRSWHLCKGALLLAVGPVLSALVVLATSNGGAATPPADPWTTFEIAAGSRPWMAALAVLALAIAPLLVRSGAVAVLVAAASLILFGSMLPGVLDVIARVTGAGPVLWRFSLAAPLAALVGLLGTVEVNFLTSGRSYQPRNLLTVGLVGFIAVAGLPIWAPTLGATFTSRPTWKIDPAAKSVAVRVARLPIGSGPVLLPPTDMQALSVTTTRVSAVVPRDYYLASLDEPASVTQDRMRLLRLMEHRAPVPSLMETTVSLADLHVSLVCATRGDSLVLQRVKRAGYRRLTDLDGLRCLVPGS
jgi:hypothetical protein